MNATFSFLGVAFLFLKGFYKILKGGGVDKIFFFVIEKNIYKMEGAKNVCF